MNTQTENHSTQTGGLIRSLNGGAVVNTPSPIHQAALQANANDARASMDSDLGALFPQMTKMLERVAGDAQAITATAANTLTGPAGAEPQPEVAIQQPAINPSRPKLN